MQTLKQTQKDAMPKIGIVTVLFNSENVLREYFQSLNSQTYQNFTLYVVDNCSPDGSLELSMDELQKVNYPSSIIRNDENLGVAGGNNQGIKAALKDECEFVLLSNNDIVLKDSAIESLYQGMIESEAEMAVPKIYFHGSDTLWCAGGGFNLSSATTFHRGIWEQDQSQYEELEATEYSPTCFMLLGSSVFRDVGLMDEAYFVYYDDTDFVYRATIVKDHLLIYVPESIIEHKVSTSTGGNVSPFSAYYMNRNKIYFAGKYLPKSTLAMVFTKSLLKLVAQFVVNHRGAKVSWHRGMIGLFHGLIMTFRWES